MEDKRLEVQERMKKARLDVDHAICPPDDEPEETPKEEDKPKPKKPKSVIDHFGL